ncbi:hypothetical protein HDU96_006439 [Phlyctochytrium bullatum]|nr:hypothetical protein HDU96_006439 [Phlyctochytrium bullatum]
MFLELRSAQGLRDASNNIDAGRRVCVDGPFGGPFEGSAEREDFALEAAIFKVLVLDDLECGGTRVAGTLGGGVLGLSLGVETARAIYSAGADVYITVRNVPKGQAVLDKIKEEFPNAGGKLGLVEMELDSLASIRKGAKEFLAKSSKLNVLINNAGVMQPPQTTTQDGFEAHFGTNHLGHFLLFHLLKPALLAATTPTFRSRVISLASVGHRIAPLGPTTDFKKPDPYMPLVVYGQSKLANIYFATELERRYAGKGIHALSVHPGAIMTELGRNLSEEDMKAMGGSEKMMRAFKSAEQGAATSVWAAVAREWEGKGGVYLEDVQESEPVAEGVGFAVEEPGHAPWAYDAEKERSLWEESLKVVGFSE